jgi:hypothetical protein
VIAGEAYNQNVCPMTIEHGGKLPDFIESPQRRTSPWGVAGSYP